MEEQAMVLRRLLVHLEKKEAEEDSEDGFAEEFSRLKMQSIQYRNDNTFPNKAALIKDNVKKNRYKDIVPFDHTRVKLSLNTSKNDEDYINASFIKGVSGSRAYIATQGPLPHTVLDFLRMIWEYKVQVVVMACREFEMGRRKCERYWPETQADPFVCGPFAIDCDNDENKGDYRTRKLSITYQNCSRALHQLHYYNWPDHGVPDSIPPILEMLQEMRICQDHDDIPIVIHCSAGCGRTGALCVIDYTWNLVKRQTLPPDFSIYDLVQHMRRQRPSVVQTKEQYELVYKTVKFLFEKYLQSFDSLACQNKVQPSAPPYPAASAYEKSHLSEESESDLKPASQCWLDPESQGPRLTPMEEQVLGPAQLGPLVSAQEKISAHSNRDDYQWRAAQEEEPQQPQPQPLHYHQHQPPLELLQSAVVIRAQVHDHEGPGLVLISRTREEEGYEQEDSEPPPKPTMPQLATACLTVEDPYFGCPEITSLLEEPLDCLMEDLVSFHTPTLTLNDQSLALDTPCSEPPESSRRMQVIIPPNAAALAISEMGGSPPSPVPPLPERTPESYELANDEALLEQFTSGHPVGLNRVGVSSEWCCDSLRPPVTQPEVKPRTRSKVFHLRIQRSISVSLWDPTAHTPTNNALNTPDLVILSFIERDPPPTGSPSILGPNDSSVIESHLFLYFQTVDENNGALLRVSDPGPRIGASSEWAGSPQPKRFLDFIFMNRSKSVRSKSSRQEPFAAVRQQAPPSVVFSGAGSEVEQNVDSVSTETSENKTLNVNNGKAMSRTRSLKFFSSRGKFKTAAPPAPFQPGPQPPPANGASSSGFKFGFGNRFAKPKGPRSYPEPWM
ncbi:unnamed protein product [Lota lota]